MKDDILKRRIKIGMVFLTLVMLVTSIVTSTIIITDSQITFNTTPTQTIRYNETSRQLEFIGNTSFIDNKTIGNTVDYFQVNETGYIRQFGDARTLRHVRVCAPEWKKGATAPDDGQIGVFPSYGFDSGSDDKAYYSLIVPFTINAGSNISVKIDWCYTGGADAGTVCWNLTYLNLATGETVDGAATTIGAVSTGNHDSGKLIYTKIGNIIGAVSEDILGLMVWRDVSCDSLATDAHLLQVHFHFIEDKMGGYINSE